MTIAKVINIGAEQLIALPTGFHIDAEQVSISKQENNIIIEVEQSTDRQSSVDMSERRASFLEWRKAYEATFDKSDCENWQNPWENLRSEDAGREFNWED